MAGEFTDKLVNYLAQTKYDDLPEDVAEEAKRILLDSIGCALIGQVTEAGRISIEFAKRLAGSPESVIIGTNAKVSCTNAAFVNGQLINAQEYDAISGNHDVPVLIAASLAAAGRERVSGKDFILAVVLGQEISKRIFIAGSEIDTSSKIRAEATGYLPSAFVASRGLSASTFGAAISAGTILNLTGAQMANAIGLAGYNCIQDTMQKWCYLTTMAMSKYGMPGWSAQAGLTSALFAELGFTGDTGVFDGNYGYWRYTAKAGWDAELVLKDLGKEWMCRGVLYKLHPAGYHKASVLNEFIRIVENNNLRPDDIEKVTTKEYQVIPGVWHDGDPVTPDEYYFYSPYLFACAVNKVKRAYWHDRETRNNPAIKAFMSKVKCITIPPGVKGQGKTIEQTFFMKPAVHIESRGKIFSNADQSGEQLGEIEQKVVTDAVLIAKFTENAARLLSPDQINRIIKSIQSLESLDNLDELLGMLIPQTK